MRTRTATLALLALILLLPALLTAATDTVVAVRLDEPVKLDGVLDEAVWSRPSVHPLFQNEPNNGGAPLQPTEWWVAYDDEAIYVAACLHEENPDSIRTRLGRRDTWPESDWVYLNLDTFNDDRNAFSFSVNPSGVMGDAQLYNDGWSDNSWDGIWETATRIHDNGWCVEIRIPFSQLRFPESDSQVWGINFSRRYSRCNGREELFHRAREESGYMNRFPDLVGIEGIHPTREVEVLVYGTARGRYEEVAADDPFHSSADHDTNAGLDLRFRPTSDLTLTATINPDFGQVEVDPAVVNLSDSETVYPEKRPFFVEDANAFRFGSEGTNNNWGFNWGDPTLLYSRRIGRSPQLTVADYDHADVPKQTTILGAAKLSGKIGGTRMAMMSALTAEESAEFMLGGVAGRQLVEPSAQFHALRVQRVAEGGGRGLGLMATGVLRDLNTDLARETLASRAWTFGLDGWTLLDDDGMWALKSWVSGSHVRGSPVAMEALQTSTRHYYQRPDASHVTLDPTRTSLSGWTGRLMLNKEKGNITFNGAVGTVSPGYEISDLGWMWRTDRINAHAVAGYSWHEPTRTFRSRWAALSVMRNWNYGGDPEDIGFGLFHETTFTNYWNVGGRFYYNPDRYSDTNSRGGPRMLMPEYGSARLSLYTDSRRSLVFGLGGNYGAVRNGSRYKGVWFETQWRPSSALRLAFAPQYSHDDEATQYVGAWDDALMTATGGRRYVFGRMDYRQLSLTTRIDWTFTPKLTLQAYLQPLFATARYEGFKQFQRPSSDDFREYGTAAASIERTADGAYLVDPDGAGPAASFTIDDPDFNYKSLKANVVLRWEYSPGSTFYFVWAQNRLNYDDPGRMDLGRDARSLIEAPGDDIVMFKVTRWLGI